MKQSIKIMRQLKMKQSIKIIVSCVTIQYLLNARTTMFAQIVVVLYTELNIQQTIWDHNSINKNQNHIKLINKKSIFYNKSINGTFNSITMILN